MLGSVSLKLNEGSTSNRCIGSPAHIWDPKFLTANIYIYICEAFLYHQQYISEYAPTCEAFGLACGGTTEAAAKGRLAWEIKGGCVARVFLKQRAKLLLDRRQFIGPRAPQAGDGCAYALRVYGSSRYQSGKEQLARNMHRQRAQTYTGNWAVIWRSAYSD